MRTALLIAMFISLFLVAWLVMRDVASRGREPATITAIDRARGARQATEKAAGEMEKVLDDASRE